MSEFKRLQELSEAYGDHNSCSVIALAAALDTTYKEADIKMSQMGRKFRRGATTFQISMAIKALGFEQESIINFAPLVEKLGKYVNSLTFNNCLKVLDKDKVYLVFGRSHVATVKNGEMIDWAKGRKFMVEEIIEVFK